MDRLLGLGVFVSAVDTGSLAAAARRFKISPAMASKHLGALEERLSVRLLHRTTRRLSVTDAGRAYYQRSKRVLEDIDEADREAQALAQSPRGRLRIATPTTFAALHLGPVIARYSEAHPDVAIEVVANDRYIDLVEEAVDVAIRIGRLADSSLVALKLAPCRMAVCAAPAFLVRYGTPVTPLELGRLPRLAFSESISPRDWAFTDRRGHSFVVDTPARMQANNMQLLTEAAVDGLGVVCGPTFAFAQHLASGALTVVLPQYRLPELAIHAVYPGPGRLPTKARLFVDQLVSDLGGAPWDPVQASPL